MQPLIIAIIQARTSSTRLPQKVLADIAGSPMFLHVIRRTQRSKSVDLTVVATTDGQADNELVHLCRKVGVECVRGSAKDVLDRYYYTARAFCPDLIVRITADCPLIDPEVIDRVIEAYDMENHDYVSNTLAPTYPDGLDTEVFSYAALERAWHEARKHSEREHVTPYIKFSGLFRTHNVTNPEDLSALRWTVDEPQDLEFVRNVYAQFSDTTFGMSQIIELLKAKPELGRINTGIGRDEGFAKSVRED